MAVPASGQLTMVGIFSEKNEDDYTAMFAEENNISLRGLSSNSHNDSNGGNMNLNTSNNPSSNRPDQNAPHQMSEFYSYDHDAVKSDRRLKTNINLIGHSKSNIPIYTFNFKKYSKVSYKWEGVMAQDLLEMGFDDSVRIADDGYYVVNYEKIDVDFKKINQ